MNKLTRIACVAGLLLPAVSGAQQSPLFEGITSDAWLTNPDTGQVTGYDFGG